MSQSLVPQQERIVQSVLACTKREIQDMCQDVNIN